MNTSILNAFRAKDTAETSEPDLHTRYLRADHVAWCEQNPTYVKSLASLNALRTQIQEIRRHVDEQESNSYTESETRERKGKVKDTENLEQDRRNFEALERRYLEWNDELASLAESLIDRPNVRQVT